MSKSCFRKIPKSRDCPWDSSPKNSGSPKVVPRDANPWDSWDWDKNPWDSPGISSFGTQVPGTKILGTGSPVPCPSLLRGVFRYNIYFGYTSENDTYDCKRTNLVLTTKIYIYIWFVISSCRLSLDLEVCRSEKFLKKLFNLIIIW